MPDVGLPRGAGENGHLDLHRAGNTLLRIAAAGDGLSVMDVWTAPGRATPLHRQRHDEALYVLEGEYQFIVGGKVSTGRAGTFVFVPRGAAHGFRNPGIGPARLLIVSGVA